MTSRTRTLALACLAGGLIALSLGPVAALAAPTSLGTFNKWTAWKGSDGHGLICYISAKPDTSLPKGANRDPIHFLVVSREKTPVTDSRGNPVKTANGQPKYEKTSDEVQTLVGYPLQQDKTFTANIDGKNFDLVTVHDVKATKVKENYAAWLAKPSQAKSFVADMRAGRTLIVKGLSTRGTHTTDTYSLKGVTAALNAVHKVCDW